MGIGNGGREVGGIVLPGRCSRGAAVEGDGDGIWGCSAGVELAAGVREVGNRGRGNRDLERGVGSGRG